MSNLTEQDRKCIKAAEGWLELGDHVTAFEELESVEPLHRADPIVLSLRYRIFAKAGTWASAFAVADGLARLAPKRFEVFIWRSYAARRMPGGGVERAMELLLDVVDDFPDEPLPPFNLACYSSVLGRMKEARQWLHVAFEVSERRGQAAEWKKKAMDEPDLDLLRRDYGLG